MGRVISDFSQNRLLQGLVALVGAVWLWGAVAPIDRLDWLLENLLVFVGVGMLAFYYRRYPLSNSSYVQISLFLMLHIVGSHYTYSLAPPGFWVQDALRGSVELDRNHYDRVIHFAFGLLIFYPVREIMLRFVRTETTRIGPAMADFTGMTIIATSSMAFEIIEWIVVVLVDPDAGLAYLGTQGDVFDAQKDSALAVLGAAIALLATRSRLSLSKRNV